MPQTSLNKLIQDEIAHLTELNHISSETLEKFAIFVIENHKKAPKATKTSKSRTTKPKPLTTTQLKEAVYQKFGVADTKGLKQCSAFQLATSGMENLNLSKKEDWEVIYRKTIGILPGEDQEEGFGCINGINIFKYDLPWRAFSLNPQQATDEDVKTAYRNLSKVYHPDNRDTGNAEIFDRLTTFYKSLTYKF